MSGTLRAECAPAVRVGRGVIPPVYVLLVLCASVAGQVQGPERVDPHEPITLSSTKDAKAYIWRISKPAKRILVDGGKTVHVWAPPGKYDVQLITINVDFDAETFDYSEHFATFTVGGTPDDPTPGPGPQPTAFKAKVAAALEKVDPAYKSFAGAIAGVYADVAGEAKAQPGSWDAATMVAEAKTRISSALPVRAFSGWSGFWPLLAQAFKDLKLDASDLQGHIKAFEDVVTVLKGAQ